MLTLEIGNRPIAVVGADGESARQLLEDDDFREDLQSITSDGDPIWDGSSELVLRQATPEEEAVALEAAEDDEEVADEGDLLVVFLVPLDDEDDLED